MWNVDLLQKINVIIISKFVTGSYVVVPAVSVSSCFDLSSLNLDLMSDQALQGSLVLNLLILGQKKKDNIFWDVQQKKVY